MLYTLPYIYTYGVWTFAWWDDGLAQLYIVRCCCWLMITQPFYTHHRPAHAISAAGFSAIRSLNRVYNRVYIMYAVRRVVNMIVCVCCCYTNVIHLRDTNHTFIYIHSQLYRVNAISTTTTTTIQVQRRYIIASHGFCRKTNQTYIYVISFICDIE